MNGRLPTGLDATIERIRADENAWNLRDVDAVVLGSRIDCQWRDRTEFIWGREQLRAFLIRKWRREIDFRIVKELWVADGSRVALRFACEFRDDNGTWFRALGNQCWELDEAGLLSRRLTSVNEHPIDGRERVLRWTKGRRPFDHPSLAELGL